MEEVLKDYNGFARGRTDQYVKYAEELAAKSVGDVLALDDLEKKIDKKSGFWIKCLILGMLAQFAGLYYITYYVAGWDLGEPISYLMTLGVELIGKEIHFFLT